MPIILLHGLGADRSEPLELFGPVLPADRAVFAPDLRAHGRSRDVGGPAAFTAEALATELARSAADWLADCGEAGPVTILGISAGAMLALWLCRMSELPIERAVFVKPAFTDTPFPANLMVLSEIAELLRTEGPAGEARLRETERFRAIAAASPLLARSLLAQFRAPAAVERAVRLAEIPRNVAFAPELAPPKAEMLVVSTRDDPVHPTEVADLWSNRLPTAARADVPSRDLDLERYRSAIRRCVEGWLS
ncbi:alpha/beta fold hydrolase [Propionicimonas sp.]|uniref:alpha/beta fold hydrolase n=1 Tax=Propionicimonas sp. TaxID=1955623 RepID=UPI0039E2B611